MIDPISIVTGLFTNGKNLALVGIGIAASIGWSMWYFSDQAYDKLLSESATKIERAQSNTVKAENALMVSNNTILTIQRQQLVDEKQRIIDAVQVAADRAELDKLRIQLESYRKRWENVATKKPGLLARIINRATIKRMRVIEAATCGTDCNTDESGEVSAESGKPAG